MSALLEEQQPVIDSTWLEAEVARELNEAGDASTLAEELSEDSSDRQSLPPPQESDNEADGIQGKLGEDILLGLQEAAEERTGRWESLLKESQTLSNRTESKQIGEHADKSQGPIDELPEGALEFLEEKTREARESRIGANDDESDEREKLWHNFIASADALAKREGSFLPTIEASTSTHFSAVEEPSPTNDEATVAPCHERQDDSSHDNGIIGCGNVLIEFANEAEETTPVGEEGKGVEEDWEEEGDDPTILTVESESMETEPREAMEQVKAMEREAEERERRRREREEARRMELLRAAREEAAMRIIAKGARAWRERREKIRSDVWRTAHEGTGSQLEAAAAKAEAMGLDQEADAARDKWREAREHLRDKLREAGSQGSIEELERLQADAPRLGLRSESVQAAEALRNRRKHVEAELSEKGPTEHLKAEAERVGATETLERVRRAREAVEKLMEAAASQSRWRIESKIDELKDHLSADAIESAREKLDQREAIARRRLVESSQSADADGVEFWLAECSNVAPDERAEGWAQPAWQIFSIVQARKSGSDVGEWLADKSEARWGPTNSQLVKGPPPLEGGENCNHGMLWPPRLTLGWELTNLEEAEGEAGGNDAVDEAVSETEWVRLTANEAHRANRQDMERIALEAEGSTLPNVKQAKAMRLVVRGELHLAEVSKRAPNLVDLRLAGNGLGCLRGIEALCGLRHLDVSWNKLESAESIAHLRELRTLRVSHNGLRELPTMSHLTRLKHLDASGNALQGCPRELPETLEVLALAGNGMTSLSLPNLPKLEEMECQDNAIAAVEPSQAPRLTAVNLACNELQSVSAAGPLLACSWRLRRLSLHGNPCASIRDYRQFVLAMAPSLSSLDGDPVPCSASWAAAALFGLSSFRPPALDGLRSAVTSLAPLRKVSPERCHRSLVSRWAKARRARNAAVHSGEHNRPKAWVSSEYTADVAHARYCAVVKMQSAARGFLARADAHRKRKRRDMQEREKRNRSAQRIQAAFRAYRTRSDPGIQRAWRSLQRRKHKAACAIQAVCRGFLARRGVRRALERAKEWASMSDEEDFEGVDMSELEPPEELCDELERNEAEETVEGSISQGHEWADLLPRPQSAAEDPRPRPAELAETHFDSRWDQSGSLAGAAVIEEEEEEDDDDDDDERGGQEGHAVAEVQERCSHANRQQEGRTEHLLIEGERETVERKQNRWRAEVERMKEEWGFTSDKTAEAFLRSREKSQKKRKEKQRREKFADPTRRLKRFQRFAQG